MMNPHQQTHRVHTDLLELPANLGLSVTENSALMHLHVVIATADIADWQWSQTKEGDVTVITALLFLDAPDQKTESVVLQARIPSNSGSDASITEPTYTLILAREGEKAAFDSGTEGSLFDYLYIGRQIIDVLREGILVQGLGPITNTQEASRSELLDIRRYKIGQGVVDLEILFSASRNPETTVRVYQDSSSPNGLEFRSVGLNDVVEHIAHELSPFPWEKH